MNIIEALESNRRYRQKGSDIWRTPGGVCSHTREELLADDWEVEERKVEVTESQLEDALKKLHGTLLSITHEGVTALKEELGLRSNQ